MFANKTRIKNPEVIKGHEYKLGYREFSQFKLSSGKWWRVIPETHRDIVAIQYMEMHRDKYAPAEGHGIIINEEAMEPYWL